MHNTNPRNYVKIKHYFKSKMFVNHEFHLLGRPWILSLRGAQAVRPHFKNKIQTKPTDVVHICNPSYSGGRDWEDRGLRPAG
jgi:hypothetical protein